MSLNQSKNNEPSHYRRTSRSGNSAQNRNYTGGGGGGGKGGSGSGSTAAPSSLPSSRSFKKINNNNTQGGQHRVNSSYAANANSAEFSSRGVQNGAHLQQPPLPGTSDVPVTGVTAKSSDVSTQRPSPGLPKVPAVTSVPSSDTSAYATPTKAPSDASRSFPLQFGSISPGFMNGMQIPARTNSAPPNLDEQKRDQARHNSIKATSTAAIPTIPKHILPKKDAGAVEQTSIGEAHQIPKAKREVQVSPAPPVPQPQKPSVHPIPGVSMQVPFHQSPALHVQFGGPNPQMQSQGMANTSLPMPIPMPLSMANPTQVPQQVFVSGIQHHPMQSQGIIPQGLNFSSQMGPQMLSHLGNMGINIPPQYQQPQASKFGGPRKTVKITHPDTHEELRLDGSLSGARSHQHVQPQPQPIPSFPPAHAMNYYSNSYNGGPLFFPAPTSNSLTGTQIAPGSQATRFYSQGGQVTVKPAVGLHGEKVGDSSLSISSPAVDKSEPPKIPRSRGEHVSLPPQRDSDTISESSLQQSNSTSMPTASKPAAAAFGSFPAENLHTNSSASSLPVEASLGNSVTEVARKEVFSRSGSFKDEQNKSGKKGHSVMEVEVTGPSVSISSALAQSIGTTNNSADGGVPENTLRSSQMILSPGSDEGSLDTFRKPLPTLPDSSVSKTDGNEEGQKSLEMAGAGPDINSFLKVEGRVPESADLKEQGEMEAAKDGDKNLEIPAGSSSKSLSDVIRDEERHVPNFITTSDAAETVNAAQLSIQELRSLENAQLAANEIGSLETARVKVEESVGCRKDDDNPCSLVTSTSTSTSELDALNAEISSLTIGSSTTFHAEKISTSDISLSRSNSRDAKDVPVRESGTLNEGPTHVTVCVSDANSLPDSEGTISNSTELISPSASSSKDKPSLEMNKAKGTIAKAKKKRKEILKNADALGTTSDLYMAYKGPEEKKESLPSADDTESSSSITSKQTSVDISDRDISSEDQGGHRKPEPDDWEDAADMSTPKLETSDDGKGAHAGLRGHSEDDNEGMTKKYSRDFLLKFSEQCANLPVGFEITSDIAEALIVSNNNSRESYPSPGRNVDRQAAGSRAERRAVGAVEDDKWSRLPGPLGPGRDLRLDIGYGGNVAGFRPVQGGNYGVLRNPRAQAPMQYIGGILSGPMQSPGPQGGMQRHSSDSDRWQRAPAYQKGLIPSPQTPMQVMHKAERKYEVGKITDEEQAKQRQLKGILNKLTPQNFEKLFDRVKQVNIDNAGTLSGVIAQIFDKALMEPTFCEMYANFCYHLSRELPDFSEDNEKITFKRLLLNKCQAEFERGEREQEEANRAEEEGEVKQTEEEREEKRIKARRRMLGNIRLIGELYKKKMLTERIMHECIKKLLGEYQNPDEEDVEALCKLMSTIGEMIDHSKAKEHMDAYFDMMAKLSNNMKLSSRVRFMLKDSIDLRKNKWQQRRKVEGPKKIEEVHRDAAQERQAQSSRLARGSSMNSSVRRGQPMDFVPRGSNPLPSPNAQMGSFRGFPQQLRGYGNQDVRFEERHAFENRTLSIPLRPLGDESIKLGPQGGLARGMSIRGQPSLQSIPIADIPSPADSRRLAAGPNGFSSVSERTPYGSREDLIPRYMTERFAAPPAYDQSNIPERNMNFPTRDMRSADRNFDRAPPASPLERGRGPALTPNISSDNVLPEERLRSMSMEAIKEFYSAKDEKEVALCIKDLNAPSFYPSMISIWVTDSFERKDMERELLAKLLINLTRSQDIMLSQEQLVKGFESVLATLEDAVNDAPKAAEFLGRIFASILLEKAMPYTEAWQLIYEGGEEVGRLVEIGLAAEVMGVILEIIQSEKGDPFLKEIRTGSNLHIENFRPPNSKKSLRIDKFI